MGGAGSASGPAAGASNAASNAEAAARSPTRFGRRSKIELQVTDRVVPDFQGRTVREVAAESASLGLQLDIQGSGVARRQWPGRGNAGGPRIDRSRRLRARRPGGLGSAMKLVELLNLEHVRGPIPDCRSRPACNTTRARSAPAKCFSPSPESTSTGTALSSGAGGRRRGDRQRARPAPAGRESVWVQVAHGREALARRGAALLWPARPPPQADRRHRHQRQDDDGLRGRCDSRGGRRGDGAARHDRAQDRRRSATAAVNTTPESLDLVRYLAELVEQGGTHATLEVSSHALDLRRVFGMDFHTAVFTNLTRDHLDYHGDMASYARAKRRLFEGAGGAPPRFGVINVDDPAGREFAALEGFERMLYGSAPEATIRAENVQVDFSGIRFRLKTLAWDRCDYVVAQGRIQCPQLAGGRRHRPVAGHRPGRHPPRHRRLSAGSRALRAGRRGAALPGDRRLRPYRRRAAKPDPVGAAVAGQGRSRREGS